MKRNYPIPGYGHRPNEAKYGVRAPITQWKDTEYQMQMAARQPKSAVARVALQLGLRVGLPIVLGFGTDFAIHHSFDLGNDAAFSLLYGVGGNGVERLAAALGSSHRENARRQGQRHESLVHEATRHRTTQRNRRDQAIHEQGVMQGAQQAQVTTRLSGAMDALRGNGAKPHNH